MDGLTEKQPVEKAENLGRALQATYLEEKAERLVWRREITSTLVFFPRLNGKRSWGIEYSIPLCYEDTEKSFKEMLEGLDRENVVSKTELEEHLQERRNRRYYEGLPSFKLPHNIRKIRVLDLSPQEGLPRRFRNIESKIPAFRSIGHRLQPRTEWSTIDKVISCLNYDPDRTKIYGVLDELFATCLGIDEGKRELLKEILSRSQANELLFVHAHGYSNVIGEQGQTVKGKYSNEFQAPGNDVDLAEVIEKYDHPETYAAILVHTCYFGNENPPVRRIPVFRVRGKSGTFHAGLGLTKTLISLPKEK